MRCADSCHDSFRRPPRMKKTRLTPGFALFGATWISTSRRQGHPNRIWSSRRLLQYHPLGSRRARKTQRVPLFVKSAANRNRHEDIRAWLTSRAQKHIRCQPQRSTQLLSAIDSHIHAQRCRFELLRRQTPHRRCQRISTYSMRTLIGLSACQANSGWFGLCSLVE